MEFEEKLESGHYNSKLTVPSRQDPNFNEARKALLIDQNRLNALFKKDILEHYGLANHPRADEIYDFAREYTDGRGGCRNEDLQNLVWFLRDLAKFINP